MKIETKCLHEGYTPKNTEPRVVPIVQSTTYVYDSTDDVAAVFDDQRMEGHIVCRHTVVVAP